MRLLEIASAIALLAWVVCLISPYRGTQTSIKWLAFLALLSLGLHLLVEGYRLQMVPFYALALALGFSLATQRSFGSRARYLAGLVALGVLLSGVAFAALEPVFQLPTPDGPFNIGTQIRHLIDASRPDPFAETKEAFRELMIQIWYPAAPTAHGELASYREPLSTNTRDARLALTKTHSMLAVPLAQSQQRYPLLLFLPSWDGGRNENTFQAEELASHGYIVVGIDHPYSTSITVFPDHRTVSTRLVEKDIWASDAAFTEFLQTIEQQVQIRASDARFVLNTLQQLDDHDPEGLLSGHLDLERIGMFGFSLGGGAAAQASWLDRRVKAVVDMDGVMAGESFSQGFPATFFYMTTEDAPSPQSAVNAGPARLRELQFEWDQDMQIKYLLSKGGGYWLTLAGSRHANFSDYAFSHPENIFRRLRHPEPERLARSINRYLVAFFDKHLKGADEPLLSAASTLFPEAHLRVFSGQ